MNSDSTLSNYCEIIMGQSPAGDTCNKIGIGIPLLNGPSEFGESHPTPVQFTSDVKRKSNIGDLLFCVRGSTGRMNWSNQEYAIGRGLAAIRAINNYPIVFVKAIIETKLHELLLKATGSVFSNVNKEMIAGISIRNISVNEAISIASTLKSIEDQISLLRKSNSTLEAIAQALFKSWFVDFDPIHTKQKSKKPEGIDEATAALFPDSFVNSELSEVPKGWVKKKLVDFCSVERGYSYKGVGLSDNTGAHMFNLGCFNAPRIYAFDNIKRYTGAYKERHIVKAGDLIVANTDMTQDRVILGRPLIIPEGFISSFISHHVFKLALSPANKSALRNFLFFSLKQSKFRERAIGYATGTTVLSLSKEVFENYILAIPPSNILNKFNEICDPIFFSIQANHQKMHSLLNLRNTLMPRLISGQLRLADIAEEINNKKKVNAQ